MVILCFFVCDPGEISEKRWIPPKMCKSDVCLEKVQYSSFRTGTSMRCDAARTWERGGGGIRDFVNSAENKPFLSLCSLQDHVAFGVDGESI